VAGGGLLPPPDDAVGGGGAVTEGVGGGDWDDGEVDDEIVDDEIVDDEGVPSVPPILFVDPEAEDPRRIIDLLLGDKKQR
jgi:hypothetical protein